MNAALLVLDIQKGFIGENARLPVAKHQVEPMLEKVNHFIKEASSQGIPVVYVGNEYEPKQWLTNILTKKAAIEGSAGAELDERLLKVNDVYFPKNKRNAFSNQDFVHYLEANEIDHVIIVGLFAEGCVTATAIDAMNKNFDVTVVKDAVSGSNDSQRDKALKELEAKGISVTDSIRLFSTLSLEFV